MMWERGRMKGNVVGKREDDGRKRKRKKECFFFNIFPRSHDCDQQQLPGCGWCDLNAF
jgi:hypothetical protein